MGPVDEEKIWIVLGYLLQTGEIRRYVHEGRIGTDSDGSARKVNLLIDPQTYQELIERYDTLVRAKGVS